MVESYISWVGPAHSHAGLMAKLIQAGGNSPESIFDYCSFDECRPLRAARQV